MGNGNIDVGKQSPTRKPGQPLVERSFGNNGLPELRIDQPKPAQAARPDICGAMAQQRGDSGIHSTPQGLLHLVGCREKPPPLAAKPAAKR